MNSADSVACRTMPEDRDPAHAQLHGQRHRVGLLGELHEQPETRDRHAGHDDARGACRRGQRGRDEHTGGREAQPEADEVAQERLALIRLEL